MAQSTIQSRLCPHCANSIALDTSTCPYCKANVSEAPPQWPRPDEAPPQWPKPDDAPPVDKAEFAREGMPLGSKIILVLGLFVFALGVYLVGGQNERSDLAPQLDAKQQELEDREAKIKALEEQLAQARQKLNVSAAQLEALHSQVADKDKSLAAAQTQVKGARRDVERLTSRANAAPLPPAPRHSSAPGLYETVRPTGVYAEPLANSRVLTRISGGTQITVVRGVGEWVEVRSKHGNPPGCVHSADVKFVSSVK